MADQPTPDLFFRTLWGYRDTAVLKAGIDLGVFAAIGRAKRTADELASACEASPRGIRILCDYLTVIGFLDKDQGTYALTEDSAVFLDSSSPAYLGGVSEFLLSPRLLDSFEDLAGAVRNGGTMTSEEGTLGAEDPFWVAFARAMMPMMKPVADRVAPILDETADQPVKVLDIAAGHGIFGISLAVRNPHLEVTALDWANVLEAARDNAAAFGVADRHHLLPGSAFDVAFGDSYDLVLLTNFLHHFSRETNVDLMRKVRGALIPGGRAAILEHIPNADRVSPPAAAAFSAMMLATTPEGDAYTYAELDEMCRAAGFVDLQLHELLPSPQRLVVATRD